MLCIPRKPHSEALHFPSQSHSSQRLSLPLSAALSLLFVFSIFLKPWDSLPLPRPHPSPPSFPLTMVKWQFGWSSSPVRVGPGLLTREIGEGVRDSAPQRGFFYKVSCAFRVKGMMFFPGVKLWLFLIRLIVFCHWLQNAANVFSLALELSWLLIQKIINFLITCCIKSMTYSASVSSPPWGHHMSIFGFYSPF